MLRKTPCAILLSVVLIISISSSKSYAQTDTDFTKSDGNNIENNPIAKNILKKIEIARKEFANIKEKQQKIEEHKKLIKEQRKLAHASLQEALTKMNDAYEEFTPRNAFAKYVSSVNATHHRIYWDQFDYLNTKIALAKDARDTVLQKGGTYIDAMKEYSKYAKMTKIEMLNVIKDLNVKHNFANNQTQSYFDVHGKLPRVKNNLNSTCYECESKQTIEKIKPIPQSDEINNLKNRLTVLQKNFVNSKNITEQKSIVHEMNILVKQIQEFKNS